MSTDEADVKKGVSPLGGRRSSGPSYKITRNKPTRKLPTQKMAVSFSDEQFALLLGTLGKQQRRSFASCPTTYDGTRTSEAVENFISGARVFKDIEGLSDQQALDGLPLLLKEDAGTWWQGIKCNIHSWEDFENKLRHAFAPLKPAYVLFQEIMNGKQDAEMTTEVFVSKKRLLFAQLPEPKLTETQQIDMLFGLLHIKIREKMPRESVKNFDELLKVSRGVERTLAEKNLLTDVKLDNSVSQTSETHRKLRCSFCRGPGHTVDRCRKLKRREERAQPKINKAEAAIQAPSPSTPKFSCYGCGAPNVIRSNCPNCHKTKSSTSEIGFCSVNTKTDARARPVVFISIEGTQGTAYIDTCAKSSIASYSLYTLLKEKGYVFDQDIMTLVLADGIKKQELVLSTKVMVTLCDKTIYTTFLVMPGKKENRTLLGVGFIQDAGIIINLPQFTWNFIDKDETYELYKEDFIDFNENIAQSSTKQQIQASLPEASVTKDRAYGPLIPVAIKKRKRTIFDGYSPVMDALYEDARRSIEEAEIELSPESDALFPNIELASIDISNLNNDEFKKLEGFLSDNQAIFISNGQPTTQAEHHIDCGNHCPVAVPPYRLSPQKTEILKVEVEKMLAQNIIEPCTSPWSSPVVLVPKKDGGTRVCIDYRQLNAITVADKYPLPRIDDLLHSAKQTPFMSTIDLRSGYWQIKVRDEDQIKTSFVTPFGMFKFLRMPFGLRNAPATFQRLMDGFRVTLSHIELLVYLDDLIVRSPTFAQHLKDLKDVFDRLREYNLVANKEKCKFCLAKVKYLGHLITAEGLKMDPEKVKAITDMAVPTNVKHLQSFLQMCSWYRRFVPNFAKISEPLTRLTRKGVNWSWAQEQSIAFDTLREKLVTAPVLAQADSTRPFIIKTDASNYAIGAVLVQGEKEEEHPVEYASRLLKPAEKNYSTTEREALAVIWAIEKFRGYIEGATVTVYTDHQSLKWLLSLKSPTGRLARWALLLQPYDINIKYINGKTNVVADTLSRPACDPGNIHECGICSVVVDMPKKSADEIREEQLKDKDIERIIAALEGDKIEDATYWSRKGYVMDQGVLYRMHEDVETEGIQLVVPKQEQLNVISTYHDDPMAGHYGADKTIERIAKRYTWKGMRAQIEDYVRQCLQCQRYKPLNTKPAGLLQTTATKHRFEIVAFDLFGPLPETSNKERWIFIIEDIASKWVELFALKHATADECARVLLDEIILRYGTPRRFISDNGVQFVSSVMQKLTFCLNIDHGMTPLYHPETNPVERKNRDLKTQLSILVGDDHRTWALKLPVIRFAMNTARTTSTGYSPAYLTFGRDLRTPDDVQHDLRSIVEQENFIPEITPKLLMMVETMKRAKEVQEWNEEKRKEYVDGKRRSSPNYQPGDLVLVNTHMLSNSQQGVSTKLAPRRDGPYMIKRRHGPSSYEVTIPHAPTDSKGIYHASALKMYSAPGNEVIPQPVNPIRRRGRPRKTPTEKSGSLVGSS